MDIVGLLPGGRYNQSAFFHKDYLKRLLDDYERKKGKPHEMLDKTMNLFWFKVRNVESIDKAATQIDSSGRFVTPAVKVETGSSAISTFIEPFRDMLWGLRFLLTPAILIVLSLVIANAISISVRERRSEMAVLKVLGFRPNQILMLVLGEVLFLGGTAIAVRGDFVLRHLGFGRHQIPGRLLSGVLHPGRGVVVGTGHRCRHRSGRQYHPGLGSAVNQGE